MLYHSPSHNIHSTTGHSSYNNSVQEPTCLLTFAHERGWAITKAPKCSFHGPQRWQKEQLWPFTQPVVWKKAHGVQSPQAWPVDPAFGTNHCVCAGLTQRTGTATQRAVVGWNGAAWLDNLVFWAIGEWSGVHLATRVAPATEWWPGFYPDSTAKSSFYPCLGDIIWYNHKLQHRLKSSNIFYPP